MQCSHIALRVKEENEHDMQSCSQPDTLPLSPSSSTSCLLPLCVPAKLVFLRITKFNVFSPSSHNFFTCSTLGKPYALFRLIPKFIS